MLYHRYLSTPSTLSLIDYYLMMKRAENARYEAALAEDPTPEGQVVSDWEMREYFEVY